MRVSVLFLLAFTGSLSAGEGPAKPAYPLWDGHESVADYAKKVNLPSTQTLDLGNGVKLEVVLIPAGKFSMGTPEPVPVDEDGFRRKIMSGLVLLVVSGLALLAILVFTVTKAIRKRQRPTFSLLRLLAMTVLAGGCLLSGLHWRQSAQRLEAARLNFIVAKTKYDYAAPWDKPEHSVTLTQPFYMGKFVVTQEQYHHAFEPTDFKVDVNPAEAVSWDDAQNFCKKMTIQTKQIVRLPTNAEWEFACRVETITPDNSGNKELDFNRIAANSVNSKSTTPPVGQRAQNAFGLYEMQGNVWQWCQDYYGADYYKKCDAENPQGPAEGSDRVMRGGSCGYDYTAFKEPGKRLRRIGFRVVMEPTFKAP